MQSTQPMYLEGVARPPAPVQAAGSLALTMQVAIVAVPCAGLMLVTLVYILLARRGMRRLIDNPGGCARRAGVTWT